MPLAPLPQRKPRPRLRVPGSAYFLTWRLAASQPPLSPAERDTALAALLHFHSVRYELHAAVVMDDHIHVVAWPLPGFSIDDQVRNWRGYMAHALAAGGRRQSPLWQRGGYDRVVWEGGELAEKVQYAVNNPRRRWPDVVGYAWVWPRDDTQ